MFIISNVNTSDGSRLRRPSTCPGGRCRLAVCLFSRRCILLCLAMLPMMGCASRTIDAGVDLPERIGDGRTVDTTGMDAYETAIVGLLDHMGDAAIVLSSVRESASAEHAVGMFYEAADRIVDLRRRMAVSEADTEVTQVELIIKYGQRYLLTKLEIEQQLKRIKQLGPAMHEPVKAALLRLEERMKQADLPTEL